MKCSFDNAFELFDEKTQKVFDEKPCCFVVNTNQIRGYLKA